MPGRTSPIGQVCRYKKLAICVIASFLSLVAQGPVRHNAALAAGQFDESTRENIRRVIPAVGIIFARNSSEPPNQYPRLRGSGVVIRSDGIVVTNYHVIKHDDDEDLYDELHFALPSLASSSAGENYRFRLSVLVTSKQHDLSLLKVSSDRLGRPVPAMMRFPTIELGDSRKLRLLDDLIIIGYPDKAGSDVTVNKGMVEGIDTVNEWIKTDARLMRGNSGGAGVNREGKLVGIPSKVVIDKQPAAKVVDGDQKSLGAVGFLRPSYLVTALLERIAESAYTEKIARPDSKAPPKPDTDKPEVKSSRSGVPVRGTIRSTTNGRPIAGARVVLVPVGSKTVTAENLIAWGGTDSDGRFELNIRVSPGRYSLKVVAFGFVPLSLDVELIEGDLELSLEMRPGK